MTFDKRPPSFATGWLHLRRDLVPYLNPLLIDCGPNSHDASVNAERDA